MANVTAAHLAALPQEHSEQATRREFGVIEGRLDMAARIARFLGTALLVTFIVGLVGALVLHATIIENQRDLDSQRSEIARIAMDTEAMQSELAELAAPARIVTDARALGMIEAPSIEYLSAPGPALDDRTLSIAANQLRANE
jgi:cell division protein FtsL